MYEHTAPASTAHEDGQPSPQLGYDTCGGAHNIEQKQALLEQAAHSIPEGSSGMTHEHLMDVLHRYYRHVPWEDLAQRPPVDVAGAALSHWQWGAQREQTQTLLRVFSPTVEENGWASPHTVIETVMQDMPFLVDSVTAELSRQERTIHLVIHPILTVIRDENGRIVATPDHHEPAPGHHVCMESWMHIEIDRESDPQDVQALTTVLHHVLADVRQSSADDHQMRAKALDVAQELAQYCPADAAQGHQPAVPAHERDEAIALLRWLAKDNFVFLGYQLFSRSSDQAGLTPVDEQRLGVLRVGDNSALAGEVASQVGSQSLRPVPHDDVVVVTKTHARATVHRATNVDYVGVKCFDAQGQVCGEHAFVGLFTAVAYTERVAQVPLIRRKVATIMARSDFPEGSHSYRDLLTIVERFPRDELLQAPMDYIEYVAHGVLTVQERRRVRVFSRVDAYDGFVSVLAYLPRDRFNTTVRLRIQEILKQAYRGTSVDSRVSLTDSSLARLHFLVRIPTQTPVPQVDAALLQERINTATRQWNDEFADALVAQVGEEQAARLHQEFGDPFGQAYKESFDPRAAVTDMQRLAEADPEGALSMSLYTPTGAPEGHRRFKIIRRASMSLHEVLPVLQHLGVQVLDERPYELRDNAGVAAYMYDFGLHYVPTGEPVTADAKQRFQDTFAAVWSGQAENDGFNALVLRANLTWRQTVILRAYGKYLRQIGVAYSQDYLEQALVTNYGIARQLVALFSTRFDPDWQPGTEAGSLTRAEAVHQIHSQIFADLDRVASLDQDRILRSFVAMMMGTVRTNYFQVDAQGQPPAHVSMKLASRELDDLPKPRPWCEIWVYSPRVEGVHLRFGEVARGGLRWSDRREDFRTEILGLVKAQMVKNAVIVPTGAKGGFVPKQMPVDAAGAPADRDVVMAEAVACYHIFIEGLLDITDNLDTSSGSSVMVHPPRVVRYDGDDPYLVVAADKGTATFSDYANAISQRYGFWLGDAFASGGSAGYDHKAMGITARGAWESVRRHFRELGRDTQSEDFTVVGIGDMSGDVFGNGMLLSPHIRLVAAFDHRSIFLDPNPDAASSFKERRRLFELPRSSWSDYDQELISAGGGVFPRTAKSIEISDQVREVLGLAEDVHTLAPAELIQAVLCAPVDLLWNGGVGTYVKAARESALDVGDKSNDAVRVNGHQLRCLVVGEGGNLGFTQLGRIEYAKNGGRINTDAIDNSAGVDTSDHEVNLKVLLGGLVAEGELTQKHRNELLTQVQDEVAQLVLRDNYDQNVVLGIGRVQSHRMLTMHRRMISELESAGELDREIEFLPPDVELEERAALEQGLSSPELAVLLAYAKIAAKKAVAASDLPEDPWYGRVLRRYFPDEVVARYEQRLDAHRLRRDIVVTGVVNDMINRCGSTFVFRAVDETGAPVSEVARAYTVIREVFDFDTYWSTIEALDGTLPVDAQTALYLEARRMIDRCVRWLLQARSSRIDVGQEVQRFWPTVSSMAGQIPTLLVGQERQALTRRARDIEQLGVPQELALRAAGLLHSFTLLDVVEVAQRTDYTPEQIAPLYYALSERFSIDTLLTRITQLPRTTRWHLLARSALRYDLYAALASLTTAVAKAHPETSTAKGSTDSASAWARENAEGIARVEITLREVLAQEAPDLAVLSVAVRAIRTLLRMG